MPHQAGRRGRVGWVRVAPEGQVSQWGWQERAPGGEGWKRRPARLLAVLVTSRLAAGAAPALEPAGVLLQLRQPATTGRQQTRELRGWS